MSMVVSVFIGFEWFVVSFVCLMIVVKFAFIFEYLIILMCFGNKKAPETSGALVFHKL